MSGTSTEVVTVQAAPPNDKSHSQAAIKEQEEEEQEDDDQTPKIKVYCYDAEGKPVASYKGSEEKVMDRFFGSDDHTTERFKKHLSTK